MRFFKIKTHFFKGDSLLITIILDKSPWDSDAVVLTFYNFWVFLQQQQQQQITGQLFKNILQSSLSPSCTKLKLGKNSGYTGFIVVCGVGWGRGWACEIKREPHKCKCVLRICLWLHFRTELTESRSVSFIRQLLSTCALTSDHYQSGE